MLRMKKRIVTGIVGCGAVLLCIIGIETLAEEYSVKEALKVLSLIDEIQTAQFKPQPDELRKVEITENEFNSYVAHRIVIEEEEALKEFSLKVLKDNRLEGKILFNLRGMNLPNIIRPEMTFYFDGVLQIKDRRARLDLKRLFLDNQKIQPMLLDLVMFFAAKLNHTEASGISDWYDLPYGIKDIRTRKGRVIFYY